MKIELTIKTTYLPNWGAWEGIRELVQNGRDAETELHAKLSVSHSGQTLRIDNEGCTLPHEALLLGHTSKADRADLIGQFGEGLKLGILALVRAGRPVKIRSGAEVWAPTIAPSTKFKADVLVFDVQGGREMKNRVRVEIGGVTESEWKELRTRFMFLNKAKKDAVVETYEGDLLLTDEQIGKVYVKGIYVQTDPRLNCGYNFKNMSVDRDRKMVNAWDMEYATQRIWRTAVGQRPDLFDRFMSLVEEGKDDIKSLDMHSVAYLEESIAKKAADAFLAKYGDDAVPVANIAECHDIEHLGRRGVVVKSQHAAVLSRALGTLDSVKAKLKEEVVKSYSLLDLSYDEQMVLAETEGLLIAAGVVRFGGGLALHVVDFRSANLLGQHKKGEVFLARHVLKDQDETLATLIHEVAHENGGDGDKGHVAAMEQAWKQVVGYLRRRS